MAHPRIVASGPFDPLMGRSRRRRHLDLAASFSWRRCSVDKSLGGYQILCAKSFGKLSVDGSQQLQCAVFSAASPLELNEITGCSQLPGLRPLQARGFDALVEQGFEIGRASCRERVLMSV